MLISVCKSKIHRATVTDCDLNYVGSISIDTQLMKLADLVPFEKVLVANVNNGERFESYVIEAKAGSGSIALNGAAARKGAKGDIVIILAFGLVEKGEAAGLKPTIVLVDSHNKALG